MIELFFTSMVVACVTAFVVTLLHKWGIVEYMQIHADEYPELVNKLFACDFCLSWWVSVFFCLIIFVPLSNLLVLLCPFIATPVAKSLLR